MRLGLLEVLLRCKAKATVISTKLVPLIVVLVCDFGAGMVACLKVEIRVLKLS